MSSASKCLFSSLKCSGMMIYRMHSLLGEPTITYCEIARDAFVRRPWYALSNIAFFITAYQIYRSEASTLARQFSATVLTVGTLSLVYDITYTYIAQLFDLAGMLVFINLLLFLNIRALKPRSKPLVSLVGLFLISMSCIVRFGTVSGDIIFGLYVLVVVATEIRLLSSGLHHYDRQWWLALGIFAVGFGAWLFDATKIVCFDVGLFNGRSLFHFAAAGVMYMMFQFYRKQTNYVSETN